MNDNPSTPPTAVSRRAAIGRAFKGAIAAAAAAPVAASSTPVPTEPPPEFVPENDYPFFGGELPGNDGRTA